MRTPASRQTIAPSIDDPIELLLACHEKVRHFSALVPRLRDHLQQTPQEVDAQARDAAKAILRYFSIAAPLHHEDEEADLFPALKQTARGAEVHLAMAELQAEHGQLAQLWQSLTPWLQAISQGQPCDVPDGVDEFAMRQAAHAAREEAQVYPFAAGLGSEQIQAIAAAMVRRRIQD